MTDIRRGRTRAGNKKKKKRIGAIQGNRAVPTLQQLDSRNTIRDRATGYTLFRYSVLIRKAPDGRGRFFAANYLTIKIINI